MEPHYNLMNPLIAIAPFFCYYLGIFIRKKVMPGKDSPPLGDQFLLGIPMSLVVVSPMIPIMNAAYTDTSAVLAMLGIFMEHGMLVNETATVHLKKLAARNQGAPTAP